MPIFLKEENSELKGQNYKIPKKLKGSLQNTLIKIGGANKNNPIRKEKGFKRLNSLVDDSYNKRSDNKPKGTVSYHELKRIKNVFDHTTNNNDNPTFVLNGGFPMKTWVNNTLSRERNKVQPVLQQKKAEKRQQNVVKPTKNPMQTVKVDNGDIHVQENVVKKIYIQEKQLKNLVQ